MLDLFEQGQLPEQVSFLFRTAESKGNHPFRNMILSVEPIKSPSTGTLSAFVFASEDEGVEWLQSHPQYNKHKIETTSPDVFYMEVDDLKTDRKIEIESLTLWLKDSENEWHEITKPLNDYLRAGEMSREQLKAELLDSVYDEYEAHVESHDFDDDDDQALSVCFSQMEENMKEQFLERYRSEADATEVWTEVLSEIKTGKYDNDAAERL